MSNREKSIRPRQMEGSVNLLKNIPDIEPARFMKKMKLHSPKISSSFNGKLGFFYEIGGINGLDVKVRRNIELMLPIHYKTRITDKTQLDKFHIIIAADGYSSLFAKEEGLLVSKMPSKIGIGVGFTVKGDFDPELIEVWLGNRFSFHGYSYLIPFSKHEASLVSASIGKTINQVTYKERLKKLAKLRKWELLNEWIDFESWYDFLTYTKDNLYVVGNAGSFTEPAFGFGLKWAIKSAKLCAKAIHENIDYNTLIRKKLLPDLASFRAMTNFFETAKNNDYDKFVKKLRNPLLKKLIESGKSLLHHKLLMQALLTGK